MREYALVLLVTAAVTYLLTPLVRRVAIATRAIHEPRSRDTHTQPTTLLGGLAMYGGLVAGLLLAQTIRPGPIPGRLLPEAQELDRSPVPVGPAAGVLSRVIEDGEMRWQLTWQQGGRSLLLRSEGSVDELLRMARSAREAP